jgi:hypothetical protein
MFMKIKALALVPVLLLTMLFAVSCGDEPTVGTDASGYVFTETVQPKLVFGADTDKAIMNTVYNEVAFKAWSSLCLFLIFACGNSQNHGRYV